MFLSLMGNFNNVQLSNNVVQFINMNKCLIQVWSLLVFSGVCVTNCVRMIHEVLMLVEE